MQYDVLAVACVERYERLTTVHSLRPTRKDIPKLEHRIVGDGIKIVVAVDETGQTLLGYFKKRVERCEGRVFRTGHNRLLLS